MSFLNHLRAFFSGNGAASKSASQSSNKSASRSGKHPSERTREPADGALDIGELQASWLIVGLGNPGPKYAATRHNVGYMAVDDVLAADGDILRPLRGYKAEVAPLTIDGVPVLVVRPTTFMNLSGEAVAPLASALGIEADHVLVIHDELDLPPHKVRLKLGGSENGHNGLKSVSEKLGTRDYVRVRFGIGRPDKGESIPDYVLAPVNATAELDSAISTAAESARLIIAQGLAKAQNTIHSR